ncbi:MAG TPA: T9SS type A sorting domain-containing protein [Bacteroidia bacterium]|jgi:hypothetical protein|nr:T9SS type A sorting domain-containing protein [Bacteroidia bacterium]
MNKLYKVIAVACFSVWAYSVSAQYVTIPDTNFAKYLDTIIPSAMKSGNQMDTTNLAVTSLANINVENRGIRDLTGVQYFKALITLDCGNGSPSSDSNRLKFLPPLPGTLQTLICGNDSALTSLPALPNSLVYLACYLNQITSLPTLPGGILHLDCNFNQLSSLPTLPGTLTFLHCGYNQITSLPVLPGNLDTLYCMYNQLASLPALPGALLVLDCSDNQLVSLPSLPGTLTGLTCISNQLTSLPALPSPLTSLECSLNQLTSIPALPTGLWGFLCSQNKLTNLPNIPTTVTEFLCDNNQLTSLPALPAGLVYLYCENNNLTSLPALPNKLTDLVCYNNSISCFPIFPNSLVDSMAFKISGNPFSCLPNYVAAMPPSVLVYPLCAPGNPNGCASTQGVVGFVYKDMNGDCIKDKGDSNLANIPVQIDSASALISQTYTAVNGVYDFSDSTGNYMVLIDTVGMPFMVQCAHPGIDSVLTLTSVDTNVNFSLTCKAGFDVGVQSVLAQGLIFPGMQHSLNVVAGDMSHWYNLNCASGVSGSVQITVSGPVTYAGPAAGALTPSVAGNVYTYTIADFGTINNTTAFNLLLNTDTTATAGDTICVSVAVTPAIDNNSGNNTYQYCYPVVNSHDPNIKTVYPVNVAQGYNGWFTYTIHFQNTGNAAAVNVLLSDTLDKNLDLKTFQMLNYSNRNTTSVKNNILTVQFHNINLPDSTVNKSKSTGFVQYRIKPKAGLPGGTVINNTGYIYFDFNAPVITDTTHNLFEIPTSVNYIVAGASCKVFPNPSNGVFTIALQNVQNKCHMVIYNEMGQEVYSSELGVGNTQVNLTNKTAGIYFYRITTETGKMVSSGKMVVE